MNWDTHCLALDFRNYRLILYPHLDWIVFPKRSYKYYKYPKLQIL